MGYFIATIVSSEYIVYANSGGNIFFFFPHFDISLQRRMVL